MQQAMMTTESSTAQEDKFLDEFILDDAYQESLHEDQSQKCEEFLMRCK